MAHPQIAWADLLRIGLQDLRLTPDQFWALTPAELGLLSGIDAQVLPVMGRTRLNDLATRFPDDPEKEQCDE